MLLVGFCAGLATAQATSAVDLWFTKHYFGFESGYLLNAAHVAVGEFRVTGNPGTLCRKTCAWTAVLPTQANGRLEWGTHHLFIPLGGPTPHDYSGRSL